MIALNVIPIFGSAPNSVFFLPSTLGLLNRRALPTCPDGNLREIARGELDRRKGTKNLLATRMQPGEKKREKREEISLLSYRSYIQPDFIRPASPPCSPRFIGDTVLPCSHHARG